MQLTLAAAAALVAGASALSSFATDPSQYNGNSSCDPALTTTAKVVNRCPYTVYLWSVLKGQGCPSGAAVPLQPGEFYHENFRPAFDGSGVSIKLSKDTTCGSNSITQLEYYIDGSDQYGANYWDVSYVNCQTKTCPTADLGYYAISGNQPGYESIASAEPTTDGDICPILSCSNFEECAKCSYVNPDDVQTKSCNKAAPLTFYMCGGHAPGQEPTVPAAPSLPIAKPAQSLAPAKAQAQKAEITSAPVEQPKPANVKTEVVYVTEVAYVNQKRHAHAHAHGHRHQHFRA